MNVVFLNKEYIDTAKAFGFKLNGSEGLTNLLDIYTVTDIGVIRDQTSAFMTAPVYNGIFDTMGRHDALGQLYKSTGYTVMDIFSVSGNEQRRLSTMNCVATATGDLVFFEDESAGDSIYANILKALGRVMSITEIMEQPFWPAICKSL